MKKGIVIGAVLLLGATVGPVGARPASITDHCVAQAAGHLAAAGTILSEGLVDDACRSLEETWVSRNAEGDTEIPTLLMAWPAVGVNKEGGVPGFPVNAMCILSGAITSPTTAQYALVGAAQSIGPATRTRVYCSAAGLTAPGDMIGPAAVGLATGVRPLKAHRVCTAAQGWFIDGSTTTTETPAGCSPWTAL